MQGLHLTADLHACAPAQEGLLQDLAALGQLCREAVAACGLRAVDERFHRFAPPGGITGVVLLAESHLALHTWPELAAVSLDIYVCNVSADHSSQARALRERLCAAFAPGRQTRQELQRGALGAAASPLGATA